MMNAANIYANNYENYWGEEGRLIRIYLYNMCKELPPQYRMGYHHNAIVQQGLDKNWYGYLNGNLIAYDSDDNVNRVLIRTRKKYDKWRGKFAKEVTHDD